MSGVIALNIHELALTRTASAVYSVRAQTADAINIIAASVATPYRLTSQAINQVWKSAFNELEEAMRPENCNPSLKLPTTEVYKEARKWLKWAADEFSASLPPPEVTPDGSGNIYIEWKYAGQFVSVEVSSRAISNTIYVEDENNFNSSFLNQENLQHILQSLAEKAKQLS